MPEFTISTVALLGVEPRRRSWLATKLGHRLEQQFEIVDTGHSLTYARTLLRQRGVARIFTCALIDKPSRRKVDVALDFVGFAIGDELIAGYGIDYAERYRELPVIVAVGGADQSAVPR